MEKVAVLLLLISILSPSFAEDSASSSGSSLWLAMKETGHYMLDGTGLQFTQRTNLVWAGMGAPALFHSFDQDKRISHLSIEKKSRPFMDHVSNFGIFMAFPFMHMGFWYIGTELENDKFVQFSKEYAATMYIAMFESGAMSYIPIHKRPSEEDLSFWETGFRSSSSFPSGHIIPYAALFFKTLQFYGPLCSSLPLLLTVISGVQRVRDGKHYLSDVVGGFFVSAFSSEGVRAASHYQDYHPFYKWWARHDLQVSLISHQDKGHQAMGPRVYFTY